MKNLFQFLGEATASQKPFLQAKKLNLKSDGHGGWVDSKGEFVAKTEGGKLKFYDKGQKPGKDPDQVRTPSGAAIDHKKPKKKEEPKAQPQAQKKEAPPEQQQVELRYSYSCVWSF